jgi:hypothetical protein
VSEHPGYLGIGSTFSSISTCTGQSSNDSVSPELDRVALLCEQRLEVCFQERLLGKKLKAGTQ